MDPQAEKDKTERVTELGRRARGEIAKWNQMTGYQFKTCFFIQCKLYFLGKTEIHLLRLQNITKPERKYVKIENELYIMTN